MLCGTGYHKSIDRIRFREKYFFYFLYAVRFFHPIFLPNKQTKGSSISVPGSVAIFFSGTFRYFIFYSCILNFRTPSQQFITMTVLAYKRHTTGWRSREQKMERQISICLRRGDSGFFLLLGTHRRRQKISRGAKIFASARGTTKTNLGRGTSFEIQGMGREGEREKFSFMTSFFLFSPPLNN